MKRADPLVVVTSRKDLPKDVPLHVVTADAFLEKAGGEGRPVVNLCRSYRYLSRGYYVSLVASARGQHVIPTVETSRGLMDPFVLERSLREARVPFVGMVEMTDRRRRVPRAIARGNGEAATGQRGAVWVLQDDRPTCRKAEPGELEETLAFFGQAEDARFRRQAAAIYREWPVPILRLGFLLEEDEWKVFEIAAEPVHRLGADPRRTLVAELAEGRFLRPWWTRETPDVRAAIAVLHDPSDPQSPSTPETIEKLARLAARKNVHVDTIGRRDFEKLSDFDALFVRSFTSVTEPSFAFALRAESLGMPVIDDPESIIRCSNKVYLYELLERASLPTPKTLVLRPGRKFAEVERKLGTPIVVKLPDGSFSSAVHKVATAQEYRSVTRNLFRQSPLLIAQQFLPTEFDWRVGVLDGKVLFVAKYFMVSQHWQIQSGSGDRVRYGRVEAIERDWAPRDVVRLALRAAALVGSGLYGVDLKETSKGPVVIEINDNPNLEVGYEDRADGDVIYDEIVDFFVERIEETPDDRRPRARPERRKQAHARPEIEALRRPIGRASRPARRYRAFEVVGLEIEYAIVDRDLNVRSLVEDVFRAIHGRPTSDVELGAVGLSNEFVDHVLELKTMAPLRSPARIENVLGRGVERVASYLKSSAHGRLLPTGMHPWVDPARTGLWGRSGRRIYEAYDVVFDTVGHGWRNVQSTHVNLPFGRESETVAMHDAAVLLLPYLPAIAASSPILDGELGPAVDNRLTFVRGLQDRIPESMGEFLPEYVESLRDYRDRILRPIYAAVDEIPGAEPLRAEFLNARAAILRFDRHALEIRILDSQECVRMDVAVAVFVRAALQSLMKDLAAGRLERPEREALHADLDATIRLGSRARVHAPHLRPPGAKGMAPVREILEEFHERARGAARKEDREYLDLLADVIRGGTLSERIRAALEPHSGKGDAFTEAARRVYIELADCLEENRVWPGRISS